MVDLWEKILRYLCVAWIDNNHDNQEKNQRLLHQPKKQRLVSSSANISLKNRFFFILKQPEDSFDQNTVK